MGLNSKISWTTHSANLWWGCVEVSPACDNCYAREWAKRYDRAKWGAAEPRLTIKGVWNDLRKFQRDAAAAGRIDRVFVGSMMDIFEHPQPVIDSKGEMVPDATTGHLRQKFFREVVPASPNLLFLLLTKRPGNIPQMVPNAWTDGAPSNVMYGTSVGTRKDYLRAVDELRRARGRRFLSIEPLLEDLGDIDLSGIDWVIVGGESGHKARPMHVEWARAIRDKCIAAKVPFLFKQWGEWVGGMDFADDEGTHASLQNNYVALNIHNLESSRAKNWNDDDETNDVNDWVSIRVGKKTAGRLLDDREWNELPNLVGA